MAAIKMDIEGHEHKAIMGMKSLMTHNKVFLQVESFDENLADLRIIMDDLGMRELPKLADQYHDYYFTNMD